MATSPIYNWPEPDNTDLVKNGALAIRTLGNAIDTTMGTMVAKTVVDAKGDLIAGTAADTVNRLAVGNNGETLVADSSTSTGLRYSPAPAVGNPVINAAMQIWQRGTSIATSGGYTADRWACAGNTAATVTRQTTSDTTNLPFIQYCARVQRNSGSAVTNNINFLQNFETINSIPFAGKTVTFSFYARAGANYSSASNGLRALIVTGTGTDQSAYTGYTGALSPIDQTATLTTTWQRFSYSATIATNVTELAPYFLYTPTGTAGANDYFEVTGVQIDLGSVALPFRTYAATIQGELAACQRYYWRAGGDQAYQVLASGLITEGSYTIAALPNPVTMRVQPTSVDFSTLMTYDGVTIVAVTTANLNLPSRWVSRVNVSVASAPTNYRPYQLFTNNSTSGYIGFSAEL